MKHTMTPEELEAYESFLEKHRKHNMESNRKFQERIKQQIEENNKD